MKTAIIGYGKMGKQIERILLEKKIEIGAIIDGFAPGATHKELNSESLKNIEVVIDFSVPAAAMENIKIYIENKVNVVMGTTGWYNELEDVKKMVGNNIGFIWSGNFSLGVNIFFRVVRLTSKIMSKFENEYDPFAYEIHHKEKADSPSGTAKMIGKIITDELKGKKKIVDEMLDRKISPDEVHFASVRGGYVPGTHVVAFDSQADTIELKHTARNREGMATGAVLAAEWIYEKKGFYSIDDMMDAII